MADFTEQKDKIRGSREDFHTCENCNHTYRLDRTNWAMGYNDIDNFDGICRWCKAADLQLRECTKCHQSYPTIVKFWGGKSYHNVNACKECQDKTRRESRNHSKYFRKAIFDHTGGYCEVCNFMCRHIAHLHHIIPVNEGGDGFPQNLILLCPNCHETVHYVQSLQTTDSDGYGLEQWLRQQYKDKQFDMLAGVIYKTVRRDKAWNWILE